MTAVKQSYMSEAAIQELIRDKSEVKKYVIDSLGYDYDGSEKFIREVKYINGITVDFKIIKNNEVIALLECKCGGIGVTDYVRGIGQLLQYEYFFEEDIRTHDEPYSKDFNTVYFYPSDVIKNNSFNIARFKYPETTKLLELNVDNYLVREVAKDELDKLADVGSSKVAISQYYFRDNRLFELFILMQYLKYLEIKSGQKIDRKNIEINHLRKLHTPNNNNWRNAFITLSSLGFINSNNLLSEAGKYMSIKNYPNFCLEILHSYIKPYVELIFKVIELNPNMRLGQIAETINSYYNYKPVLFVTDSDNRYISSWLNILRDDYGCLSFESRSNNRTIRYNPAELKNEFIIKKIATNPVANEYINNFNNMIRSGSI
jgi:hypothetical protein